MLINIYKYYIGRGKGSIPPPSQMVQLLQFACLPLLSFTQLIYKLTHKSPTQLLTSTRSIFIEGYIVSPMDEIY